MYHDQGLPVIKYDNFSRTTNVTLGLPITRVSVDHGTVTDLVGTGNVDISSFVQALKVAVEIFQKCIIKRFGQHFIIDQNVIDKLVTNISPSKKDFILEIGPGNGAKTKYLINKVENMILIEKDTDLLEDLNITIDEYPNCVLINNDILKYDLNQIDKRIRVVGNHILFLQKLF